MLQLTYFEFAKEELEVLDMPTGTNNSSFTSTSDDTLDSGEDSGELAQNGRDQPAGEQQCNMQRRHMFLVTERLAVLRSGKISINTVQAAQLSVSLLGLACLHHMEQAELFIGRWVAD